MTIVECEPFRRFHSMASVAWGGTSDNSNTLFSILKGCGVATQREGCVVHDLPPRCRSSLPLRTFCFRVPPGIAPWEVTSHLPPTVSPISNFQKIIISPESVSFQFRMSLKFTRQTISHKTYSSFSISRVVEIFRVKIMTN